MRRLRSGVTCQSRAPRPKIGSESCLPRLREREERRGEGEGEGGGEGEREGEREGEGGRRGREGRRGERGGGIEKKRGGGIRNQAENRLEDRCKQTDDNIKRY